MIGNPLAFCSLGSSPGEIHPLEEFTNEDAWTTYTRSWTGTKEKGEYALWLQYFFPKLNLFYCTCPAFKFRHGLGKYLDDPVTDDSPHYKYFYVAGRIQEGCKHTDAALTKIDGIARDFNDEMLSGNWYEVSA